MKRKTGMDAERAASLARGFTEFGYSIDAAEVMRIWEQIKAGTDNRGDPVAIMLRQAFEGKVRDPR